MATVESTFEEEEALEHSFFIDANLTANEADKIILKWMSEQIDDLRFQYYEGKMKITERKLTQDDFFRIMMIIQGRYEVMCKELKTKLSASRSQLIKDKGIESLEYLKQMIEDTKEYCEIQGQAI